MATLKTVKVMIEFEPIKVGQSGDYSVGELVDRRIAAAMESGDTLQDVQVSFEPEEWLELAESYHGIGTAHTKSKRSGPVTI